MYTSLLQYLHASPFCNSALYFFYAASASAAIFATHTPNLTPIISNKHDYCNNAIPTTNYSGLQ